VSSPATGIEMAMVGAGAVVLAAALGPPTIAALRRGGVGQRVRDDGPQRHLEKQGTPTMGGVFLLAAWLGAAVLGQWLLRGEVSLTMVTLLALVGAFAAIGAADDWRKVRRGRSLGLRAREKLALQVVAAGAFVYALVGGRMIEAACAGQPLALGAGGMVFWVLATVATSNAVNLADGLDGLAAGLCVIAAVGFGALALDAGQGEVALFAAALGGACAGFLFFNRHPARVFMGDVGSLGLGAALAGMAAWLDRPVALLALCLVPFLEELSVIAQVISFKTTGRRILRMSPLHHHFELSGWSERRVVWTFWVLGAAAAAALVAAAWRA